MPILLPLRLLLDRSPLLALVPLLSPAAALAFAPAAAPPAAPANVPEPPSFFIELLSIMLPVAVVLVGLVAVLYYLRKRHGLTARDNPLSVLQVLPVGPRERIVVLRTRSGRALAVGVGGQSMSLIAELDSADIAPLATATTMPESTVAAAEAES
ncbi:flagellar biosynthetic protein FliO [Lysobacter antibioticus]|uniref:flagellar biosynthetic protein FliO n=1 Tax=Lysobacter antibioticus TaxID=84531 RepID=UPI0007172316|nr:flagellar biosynthetic protein FliO [Lysobacter antibioticus]